MFGADLKLALFMEGALADRSGKMGFGLLRYSANPIVAVVDSAHAGRDCAEVTGIARSAPVVASLRHARDLGAEALVLGIAPSGGRIPDEWRAPLDHAVELGMSLVNGLHEPLAPRYFSLRPGQHVWDIRQEPVDLAPGSGQACELNNRRVLMVGTDMSVGKMSAGLEIHRSARARSVRSAFVATGQIGVAICGRGVALDAVRVDYAAGAIEREVMAAADADLVIVEGQGSLIHPGATANLALLRGACPTHLVVCHRAGMEALPRFPWVRVPPLLQFAKLYEDLASACGNLPRPRTAAVALNTAHLDETAAREAIARVAGETGLPTTDPVRFGADPLLDGLLGG